jgi:hypothetical protein
VGRIRSIKPEFPQSETTGALSRDARLLFIQLWTIVDDEGRARASSRLLASLLYPFDKLPDELMDEWLDELEEQNAIRRYVVNGTTYLEIVNWLIHQKIDHPGKSRLPASSDILASPRETLATDLGPRTIGPRKERVEAVAIATRPTKARATGLAEDWTPTPEDRSFALSKGLSDQEIETEGIKFRNYWTAKAGKDAFKKNWHRTWQNWLLNNYSKRGTTNGKAGNVIDAADRLIQRIADFDKTPIEPELRGGTGENLVRLLPPRGG